MRGSLATLRRLALVALCALAMTFAAGCVGIHSDPDSDLPGNAPASWEGKTLGVPI